MGAFSPLVQLLASMIASDAYCMPCRHSLLQTQPTSCPRRLLLLFFMSSMNLKSSFFITTFADEALELFLPATADMLATTFNVAFPLGGFLTSALASYMLARLSEREVRRLALASCIPRYTATWSLLHKMPSLRWHAQSHASLGAKCCTFLLAVSRGIH